MMLKVYREHRFLILLVSFILYWTIAPLLDSTLKLRIASDILFSLILLSAIHAAGSSIIHTLIAVALAIPVYYGVWEKYVDPLPDTTIFGLIFSALFTGYVMILFLQAIFRSPEVDLEVVSGAAVVYLFLGLLWGDLYFILEHASPNSFEFAHEVDIHDYHLFNYFSFVTLSTLGYGEITPITRPAKSLASMEALVGQLYIAVLIARLVSVYSSQRTRRSGFPENRE